MTKNVGTEKNRDHNFVETSKQKEPSRKKLDYLLILHLRINKWSKL